MSLTDLIPGAQRMVAHYWPIARQLARTLSARLGKDGDVPVSSLAHREYRAIAKSLAFAEALLRRVLVLIAMSFPAPAIKLQTSYTRKPSNPSSAQPICTQRRPYFALSEPEMDLPAALTDDRPAPRARVIDFEAMARDRLMQKAMPQPAPYVPMGHVYADNDMRSTERLLKRLDGLIDVIENTGHHTARMARWIRSRQLRVEADDRALSTVRTHPIRTGPPPQCSRKRMGQSAWENYVMLQLQAMRMLLLGYDDSS